MGAINAFLPPPSLITRCGRRPRLSVATNFHERQCHRITSISAYLPADHLCRDLLALYRFARSNQAPTHEAVSVIVAVYALWD